MPKYLVAFNTICCSPTSVRQWSECLYADHLDVSLLIYAPLQYHPAYQTRYLKTLLQFVHLVECPMFAPNEYNRKAIDAYILRDTHEFVWRFAACEQGLLLSPSREAWPVPNGFRLPLLYEQGAGAHALWNPGRLGLKSIDKAAIMLPKEDTHDTIPGSP